jgi:hypothetical protein
VLLFISSNFSVGDYAPNIVFGLPHINVGKLLGALLDVDGTFTPSWQYEFDLTNSTVQWRPNIVHSYPHRRAWAGLFFQPTPSQFPQMLEDAVGGFAVSLAGMFA